MQFGDVAGENVMKLCTTVADAKVAGIIHTQHALHVTVEQQDAAVCCRVQLHTWV